MIRGFFDPRIPWPAPRLWVGVAVPSIASEWKRISFLLDTGSVATSIHPVDAMKVLGISADRLASPSLWSQHETVMGVGGTTVQYIVDARYLFVHRDGAITGMNGPIRIAQLRPDNMSLPSVLGWDVMQHFSLRLDWASRSVILDQPGSV